MQIHEFTNSKRVSPLNRKFPIETLQLPLSVERAWLYVHLHRPCTVDHKSHALTSKDINCQEACVCIWLTRISENFQLIYLDKAIQPMSLVKSLQDLMQGYESAERCVKSLVVVRQNFCSSVN